MSAKAPQAPRPDPAQLAPLSPRERRYFGWADAFVRRAHGWSRFWNSTFMANLVRIASHRRLRIEGIEHVQSLGPQARLLLVSNHRSFFDFFLIMSVLNARTTLSLRCFFPVRSTFFYDHPLGPLVNLMMSGMAMFPPIMRHRSGVRFNDYALLRCAAELQVPGTIVGIHPEGTRNKNPDPYTLLKVTRGVGRIALAAGAVPVLPIFVLGCGNNLLTEISHNLFRPATHPLDVMFGAPIELSDLVDRVEDPAAWKIAAARCADGIESLGASHRARYAQPENVQKSD